MKLNKILILLLFAMIGSSAYGAESSQSSSSSSSSLSSSPSSSSSASSASSSTSSLEDSSAESTAESNTDTVSMQMDLGLDSDSDSSSSSSEQYSNNQQEQNDPSPSSSSMSQQFSMPQFGLRKSNYDQSGQDGLYQGANSQSSVVHYEPISASYQKQQQQQQAAASSPAVSTTYREFFKVDDERRPIFESNTPSDSFQQQYGQQSSQNNNDDNNNNNNNGNSGGNEQQQGSADGSDDGGFRPIAMSVDEAFRKYFPESKMNDQLSSQTNNDQQSQSSLSQQFFPTSQSSQQSQLYQSQPSQFIPSIVSGGQAMDGQVSNLKPTSDKELYSIDTLREIVEKQPLAKPNPFDPPSPPLSAFLPPPPNSRPELPTSAESSYSSTQYGGPSSESNSQSYPMSQSSQSSYPQSSFSQSSFLPPQESFVQQQQPSYAQPQVQTKFVYEKQPEQSGSTNGPVVDDVTDEEEDEGLPYKTDSGEGEKKVSYIYSRPVQLPDVTRTKVVETYDNSNYGKGAQFTGDGGEHIYRKPVSYENDEDGADHGNDDSKHPGPNSYDELEQAYNPLKQVDSGSQNNGGAGYPPIPSLPPKISMYPTDENNDYRVQKPQQPQQPQTQWININAAGGGSSDYLDSNNKNSDTPSNIEYGGFVPIKHQGQEFTSSIYTDSVPQKGPYDIRSYPQQNYNPMQQQQQSRPQYGQGGPTFHLSTASYQDTQQGSNEGYDNTFKFPMQPPQQQQQNYRPNYQSLRFKPIYGKDASKKLQELGINENEFYGTVNNILQKAPFIGKPNFYQKPSHSGVSVPYMPKANMYKAPPKNYRGQKSPYQGGKNRPISNTIAEEFDLKYLKDDLPPGASYNPRDVGLDESVLAQIHLLDSGIGGYRFPTIYPESQNSNGPSMGKLHPSMAPPRPSHYKKHMPKGPFGKGHLSSGGGGSSGSVPYATNSIAMPFILQGPKSFLPRRVPYSSSGKGFRSQYGYRAAASEVKPQFSLPNASKGFKFLGQPLSASNIAPLLASALSDEGASNAFGNMFGIKSIKGIKSLVSYLTGGVKS